LVDLCIELGAQLLLKAEITVNIDQAKQILQTNLQNGKAFLKMKEFIANQGGDISVIDDLSLLPQAKYSFDIISQEDGYIAELKAMTVGIASMMLGAGRENKDSVIDLSAGIYLSKKTGDAIRIGDKIATLYTNSFEKIEPAALKFNQAFKISKIKPLKPELILDSIY
jgi:pyrimidine-nucleoside phosphorylase